jgi:hypothetical protein
VQLSGFTNGVTTATVAAKLTEKYPYITLGDNATLNGSNAAYTYSNKVTLPFKVSSVSDATKTYWYNIYYPSNGDARNPNYIAALNNEDKVVDMAASPKYAYGENPTYNTKAGNPMISWAIYSANNSLEFIFKNELTNKNEKSFPKFPNKYATLSFNPKGLTSSTLSSLFAVSLTIIFSPPIL